MTCRITVWTPVTDEDARDSSALVRHLDSQTAPIERWELVLATSGGAHVPLLERLAARRPNVRVVVDGAEGTHAEGEWVLPLSPDDRLDRGALSSLLGLVSEAGVPDSLVVSTEAGRPGGSEVPILLVRRDALASEVTDVERSRERVERVVPAALRSRREPWAPARAGLLEDVTADANWVDDVLELRGRAPLHAAGATHVELVLVGRHHGQVRVLPIEIFTVSGDDEDSEPGLEWSARVHLAPEDRDDELEVWLQVAPAETDDESDATDQAEDRVEDDGAVSAHPEPLVGRVAAGPGTDAPAVLDGRLVCARSDGDALVIDLGATGRSLLGHLDPRRTSVVENPSGSLLTVGVPQLAHHGRPRVVQGSLLLDGHPLSARLVVDDSPRVECRLATLPGTAVLEWSFGPGPAAATGCDLVTSGTGEFTVVASRPDALHGSSRRSTTGGAGRAHLRPQASGPVAALRRRLPHGVDPVVSRLSKVPAFRDVYRRVTGLHGPDAR
ncbi:hypothetical protein [Terrabacter sp. C0L_2]|uniref:hypothetical protein n=1 Tax=Terrabacter sp. C0L_2 TaxID=3108389 RepID=UPI002ED2BA20|nr:hypothetical protein U5C87_20580 [Terrabacter sp. C0L_2]